MASKSSFLPRLGLSSDTLSPWASPPRSSNTQLRTKRSEYDLDDLSARSDPLMGSSSSQKATIFRDDPMPSPPLPDTPPKSGRNAMFNGPPPPIFSRARKPKVSEGQSAAATATSALYGLGSALFNRRGTSSVSSSTHETSPRLEQDTVWQSFQRRERALQRDAQRLLDLQANGLSAGLGHAPSDNGTQPPSSGSSSPATSRRGGAGATTWQSRLSILDPPTQANDHGQVMPVRQPRTKPVGLRGARAGLGRTLKLLADLRAEEDACLASALGHRKSALVKVRKMNTRREGLLDELKALESDDEEPLARELRDLQDEHGSVCGQIEELEEKLSLLKSRQRRLEDDMSTLVNRREAGLSGYRGALKEVDAKLADVLSRPPVKPLDISAFKETARGLSPCGLEFLSLNPERRTAGMAMDWWDKEVLILERRKKAVDKERLALEEGAEIWVAATKLVTAFESELRGSITAGEGASDQETSQEKELHMQLTKMETVINGLEDHLQYVEQKGWNLLICAIGAELEAFREAYIVLRSAMVDIGIEVDDDATPRLARSITDPQAAEIEESPKDKGKQKEADDRGALLDLRAQDGEEDDNPVPHDPVDSSHDHEKTETQQHSRREPSPSLDREESDNEIPPEFLREHQD